MYKPSDTEKVFIAVVCVLALPFFILGSAMGIAWCAYDVAQHQTRKYVALLAHYLRNRKR